MDFSEIYALMLSPVTMGGLGLLIGSFLNVVVHRFPLMLERRWAIEANDILGGGSGRSEPAPPLTLSKPDSNCPHCGHRIRWFENLPVISWLALRGKCSSCEAPISKRYPLIELATAALFAAVTYHFAASSNPWVVVAWCGFVAMLLAMSLIDWDTTLLPDDLTLPLMWAGLLASLLGLTIALPQAVVGAMAGYGVLWTICTVFALATGREGMGGGDLKLLAALGAWLGWQMLLPIAVLASALGIVGYVLMKLRGKLNEELQMPFGPYLAGAGAVVMFAGSARVLEWIGWA